MNSLRQLRLFHWKKYFVHTRCEQNATKMNFESARQIHWAEAMIHLRAVQVLNDCFELGDTAELDAFKEKHGQEIK